MADFVDRVTLITGPAKGMGAAITRAFAEGGSDLILAGRDVPAIELVAEEARAIGSEGVRVDRQQDDIRQAQQDIERPRQHAGSKGDVDELDRSAVARVPQAEAPVRKGGQKRHRARDDEGDRRSTPREFYREPRDGEDAASHHAADSDGKCRECADLRFRHASTF